ncbi:hypothetical protein M4D81_32915 [Paenibacillus sp. p3-SID867]|uniref:hypothetical protein n=1 Tax=Paenibacillus sp. p3-SID867 TaxID=2916363 RepID=UPI0021A413A1|nr:hypothetical protein [Paenibacillus sp. p3-SID867]MCT1403810.1 hypothetical protein [Paenibacillus sp. p3-SID867]
MDRWTKKQEPDAENEHELKKALDRYIVEKPTVEDTALFAASLMQKFQIEGGRPTNRLQGRIQALRYIVQAHMRLFGVKYWLSTFILSSLGFVIELTMNNNNPIHPVPFTVALLALASVCFGFRSYGTPMFQLELTLPANPFIMIFSRLTIIAAYCVTLGIIMSFFVPAHYGGIYSYLFSWLIPLGICSLTACVFLFYFGVFAGLLGSTMVWLVQLLLNERLGLLFWFSETSHPDWLESKVIGAAFILVLLLLLMYRIQKMTTNARMVAP